MPFQILSLSGGGYLGYYTAAVLDELEAMSKAPLARCFDLMAGTSVGGIIALCLSCEIPMARIRAAFEEHGTRIFSDRPKSTGIAHVLGDLARSALAPRNDDKALRSVVTELLGKSTRLGDLKHRALISSVDLTSGAAHGFASWDPANRSVRVVDVAMATSAVPTFFPMVRIGKRLYADGGLFANAPDLLALDAAQFELGVAARRIRLLSVGTASASFSLPRARETLGALDWFTDEHLMRISMAAQQTSVVEMLQRRLGDRYLRVDRDQSPAEQQVLGLNVATPEATRRLGAMARKSVSRIRNDARLKRMLRHQAPRRAAGL